MISFLTNLKLRRKLLLALLPLALMVIIAGLYATSEIRKIDTRYSELVDQDVRALQYLTQAKVQATLFGQLLYAEIAELDPGKMHIIDSKLEQANREYQNSIAESIRSTPNREKEIQSAAALFNQVVSDAGPVRASTLNNDNERAMNLMRGGGTATNCAIADHHQSRNSQVRRRAVRRINPKNASRHSFHLVGYRFWPACFCSNGHLHRAETSGAGIVVFARQH
jgi:hypothetical protein